MLSLGLDVVAVPAENQQVAEAAHAAEGTENVIEHCGVMSIQFPLTLFGPRQPVTLAVYSEQRDGLCETHLQVGQLMIKAGVGHGRSVDRACLSSSACAHER